MFFLNKMTNLNNLFLFDVIQLQGKCTKLHSSGQQASPGYCRGKVYMQSHNIIVMKSVGINLSKNIIIETINYQ